MLLRRSMSSSEECSVLVVDGQRLVQEVPRFRLAHLFHVRPQQYGCSPQACLPQACQRHKTSPTASAALGRALLGTLLLATFRGEGETTQVTFQGNGPLGQIQVRTEPRLCTIGTADFSGSPTDPHPCLSAPDNSKG